MNLAPLRFFALSLRRLRSRAALALLSLLSIILSIGIIVSIPVVAEGVSYLVLRDELAQAAGAFHRPLAMRFTYSTDDALSPAEARAIEQQLVRETEMRTRLPIGEHAMRLRSPSLTLRPGPENEHIFTANALNNVQSGINLKVDTRLLVMSSFEDRIEIIDGDPWQDSGSQPTVDGSRLTDNALQVWVHHLLANQMGLQPGEIYSLTNLETDESLPITIAGIWRERDVNDTFWRGISIDRYTDLLVTEADYEVAQSIFSPDRRAFAGWYILPDEAALTVEQADGAARGMAFMPNVAARLLPGIEMDVSPLPLLERYLERRTILVTVLLAFSVPILALLFYFLWLLSAVVARSQREETAILVSRGAGRLFLGGLVTVEALILIALGLPLGLAAGYGMALTISSTAGFLTFAPQARLPVTLAAVDWRLLAGALLLLLLARVAPALQDTRRSIVTHLRERSRPVTRNRLAKLALDATLVALTVYAYQQLTARRGLGIITELETEASPAAASTSDPLLLLAPALFVFTSALLFAHLFPTLMALVDFVSRRLRLFALYMGVQQLRRQSAQYAGALVLIIVCLGLGAFYASMSASLDRWLQDRIAYQVGADYRFTAGILRLGPPGQFGVPAEPAPSALMPWLIPLSDYREIPGVRNAARVGFFPAQPELRSRQLPDPGRVMGIDRMDFAAVAYQRPDFYSVPLGELMNRLGMVPNGLLVSRRFLEEHSLVEGQEMSLVVEADGGQFDLPFTIVGSYDYFPTAYPEQEELFVANLDYLFAQFGGPVQHEVWLETEPGVHGETIRTSLREMDLQPEGAMEVSQLIGQEAVRVERIGLFGILSVGFLTGALVAALGLLVFTYASLQSRLQEVGVLRALGIQLPEVLGMIGIEYAGVVLYGIAAGGLSGVLAAALFVRFFRFSSEAALAAPPFVSEIAWNSIGWLVAVFAIVLVITQALILQRVARQQIVQVLRMGSRE